MEPSTHARPQHGEQPQPPWPAAPRPRRRTGLLVAVVALTSSLAGGAIGGMLVRTYGQSQEPIPARPFATQVVATGGRTPAARAEAIARAMLPAVVQVEAQDGTVRQTGSGVLLTPDGYALTNNHVVSGVRTIGVTLSGGQVYRARLIGADPADDLAVLKIAASGLPVPSFGSAAGLQVGQPVVAVGNPFGFQGSLTSGIVSALHRVVSIPGDGAGQPQEDLVDAIQTDAAINPGNSGGALADGNGDIVGITTAIATADKGGSGEQADPNAANAGVGFAIPIDQALQAARALIAGRRVPVPFIGVEAYADLSPDLADQYQLQGRAGALIKDVDPGGPAARAGLTSGDLVTRVGTMDVRGSDSLKVAVRETRVDQPVDLTVVRLGRRLTVRITPIDGSAG